MGIRAFAPHFSKRLGQFCSLTQEQSLVQSIMIGASPQEVRLRFLCFFLTAAH